MKLPSNEQRIWTLRGARQKHSSTICVALGTTPQGTRQIGSESHRSNSYTWAKQDGSQDVRMPGDNVWNRRNPVDQCAQSLPRIMAVKLISMVASVIPLIMVMSLAEHKDSNVSLTLLYLMLRAVKTSGRSCAKAPILIIAGDSGSGQTEPACPHSRRTELKNSYTFGFFGLLLKYGWYGLGLLTLTAGQVPGG